jgi:hypothetical protein
VASEGFLAVPANREKHVGDVERAVHPESGWEEKLLASKHKESIEGSGGGGYRLANTHTFENYRVAERWRWSASGGTLSGSR